MDLSLPGSQAGEATDFSTVIGNEPAGKVLSNFAARPHPDKKRVLELETPLKKSVSLYLGDGGCTFLGDLACFKGFW